MSDGTAYATGGPEQAGEGGSCVSCGRALPAPDLEAVAASIDQTLSLETGRMVPRTAWAGRAPDGVMDALLFWMPSVKANRQLWERGQTLWTEQMTVALSGPCDACQGLSGSSLAPPAPTLMQGSENVSDPPAAQYPYDPHGARGTAAMELPSTISLPADEPADAMTSAIPSSSDYGTGPRPAPASLPDEDPRTTAFPSFSSNFGGTVPSNQPADPPLPEGDEHESHTVMLSALPSFRVSTRLIVLEGPVRGRQFSLGRDRTTIGRSIGCHVTVEADSVEYDHARVIKAGASWRLEQATSAADLFVNDEPVTGSRTLNPGDIIRIGPARLRFESAS